MLHPFRVLNAIHHFASLFIPLPLGLSVGGAAAACVSVPRFLFSLAFMAQIKPFAALRPRPDWAPTICELPYDVMSSAEAREMARGNPRSFLHVSKPEIDLPESVDVYDARVYAKGVENFKRLMAEGALKQDAQPCYYFYRQIMGKHSQTGLVAVASCQEYRDGIIKKHEFTRRGQGGRSRAAYGSLELANGAGLSGLSRQQGNE